MRTLAALTGVVGGLCWVVSPWLDLLRWAGVALVAVAVLAAGAGLVSRGVGWLRLVVSVCLLALVASVLSVVSDNFEERVVLVAAGALAVAIGAVALSRRPASRGAHAR